MKKTFGILLMMLSFSAMANDVSYNCSFNAKVDTVKTNIFGGSPRTVSVADFNPCQAPTVPSIIHANSQVSLTECGVFTDEIQFGLTLRAQKLSDKSARVELIHLARPINHENDYKYENILGESIVEIGKEVVIEAKTKIDFYKKSRRVKEVVTAVSILCLRAK
jgi:hypothetical protein